MNQQGERSAWTERDERIFQLDREGKSAREIAAIVGLCDRTIQRWRKSHGLSRGKGYLRTPDEVRARALDLIRDGCSFTEAADTVGVTAATIREWFPGVPAWTKSQAGTYAVMRRRMRKSLREAV